MTKTILPSLDEEDYDVILERAEAYLRRATSGYRGQLVTVYDSLDYWIMKATQAYLQEKINEDN